MRLHKIKILFISRLKILFIINLNTKMGILCGLEQDSCSNLGQDKHQIRNYRSMRTKNFISVSSLEANPETVVKECNSPEMFQECGYL